MKKKENNGPDLSTSIAIASLAISVISLVWIGGFRMSALIHEVGDIKENVQKMEESIQKMEIRMNTRFDKIETRIDRLEGEFQKMDVRVTTIEQGKP